MSYLQTSFEGASGALHLATYNNFYFKEVTVVVPPTWEMEIDEVTTTISCEDAHFLVDTANPLYGDTPYTKHGGKCGQRGEYVHLTFDYLDANFKDSMTAKKRWGDISKCVTLSIFYLQKGITVVLNYP